LSLLNQQGSKVVLGNMLVIPMEQSLLYVQPLYVKADQNPVPEFKKVIVISGNQAVMTDKLQDALAAVTGGPAPPTQEQQGSTTPVTPPGNGTAPPASPGPSDQSTQQLYDQAQADFVAADNALK